MLIFQNPTPNPTPFPPAVEQAIVDTAMQTVMAALQQQAVGVLVILALSFLVWRVGILIQIYVTRNRPGNKEDTAIKGVSDALGMFGKLWERDQEDKRKERQETAEQGEKRDKEFAAREQKWTETLDAMQKQNKEISQGFQAGIFKIAEITGEQTPLLKQIADQTAHFGTVKSIVETMSSAGSEPVQIIKTNSEAILKIVTEILNAMQNLSSKHVLREEYNTSITEINLAISALRGVVDRDEKRRTDSQPIVIPPTETVNVGAQS